VYGSEEVSCGLIVASGDAAEELQFGEEVLDQVPCFVEFLVVLALFFPVFLGRNDGFFACFFEPLKHPFVRVVALVGDHRFGFELWQQHIGPLQIAGLAFGEIEAERVAERIDGSVDLGAQPALAVSDGF
jgi:hypothetical protein